MRDMAAQCRDLMLGNGEVPRRLGALLNEGWRAKRTLASTMTVSLVDVQPSTESVLKEALTARCSAEDF